MNYCFSRKISGGEIAGVWKLAGLVTAQEIFKDGAKCRRAESDVITSLYSNGVLVVLVLSVSLLTGVLIIITYFSTGYSIVLRSYRKDSEARRFESRK